MNFKTMHFFFGSVLLGFFFGLAAQGGCRFDPVASVGQGGDSGPVLDSALDAAWLQDGGADSRPDGGLDAALDAVVDSSVDGTVDGALDGALDSSLDSSVDASVDAAEPDAGCLQGDTRCNGDSLEICDQNGNWTTARNCPVGCDSNRNACRRIVPSNGLDQIVWSGTLEDIVVSGPVVVNSDDGTIVAGAANISGQAEWASITQPANCGSLQAPDISVFRMRSLTIQPGGVLRFVGSKAVAILSQGDVQVSGLIDVSGGAAACPSNTSATAVTCAGPGGWAGGIGGGGPADGSGPGAGGAGENGGSGIGRDEAGGGGAGHAASGGKGGDATGITTWDGGDGGSVYGDGSSVPLCGGSGGGGGGPGSGASVSDHTSHGGGGGGTIQIVSQTGITLLCAGPGPCGIRATGAGGMGDGLSYYDDGGGGGGSGGTVLLESPSVTLGDHGVVSVAGGGGGCGYDSEGNSLDGDDGPFGPGRTQTQFCDAQGGLGGGGDHPAGDAGADVGDGGGGGGGAAGWIRINCYQTSGCFSQTGVLNPEFSTNAVSLDEATIQ